MTVKEEIKLERIKLTIRSRLSDMAMYKSVVRNKFPRASDQEFEEALQDLVAKNFVVIRAGNGGAEILTLGKLGPVSDLLSAGPAEVPEETKVEAN